jgi:hypothetical protein
MAEEKPGTSLALGEFVLHQIETQHAGPGTAVKYDMLVPNTHVHTRGIAAIGRYCVKGDLPYGIFQLQSSVFLCPENPHEEPFDLQLHLFRKGWGGD